jgi:aspartate racemase
MKTIGLIGGTTWHSTIDYYRYINEGINRQLGGNSSAKILLYSLNFAEIELLTGQGNWHAIGRILSNAAQKLEGAGAECLLLCANTMHLNAEMVEAAVNIPLIHIADVTVNAIKKQELDGILLLGTKYTMQSEFYAERFKKAGIELFTPGPEDMELINRSIYHELGKGIILPHTKQEYLRIVNESISRGAKGVILGCTEIPLLLQPADSGVPLFDTVQLHSSAAIAFAVA